MHTLPQVTGLLLPQPCHPFYAVACVAASAAALTAGVLVESVGVSPSVSRVPLWALFSFFSYFVFLPFFCLFSCFFFHFFSFFVHFLIF